MVLPWLKNWAVFSLRRVGPSSVVLRKELMLQPIAVLGTPLDRVYPAHHRSLQQQIGRQGLLISPSRSGCRVRPGHFAARNRWLVAFAQALMVVECPQRSGALISARWASRL